MPSFHELGPGQKFFFARIFLWFIVLLGVGSMYLGLNTMNLARQSTGWPSVQGTVTESRIHSESHPGAGKKPTYHANVEYAYTVDGEEHTGDRVSFGEYGTNDPSHAQAIIGRYPKGNTVAVYHDPDRPGESVLEPGSHGIPWFYLILGMPFLIFGLGLANYLPKMAEKGN